MGERLRKEFGLNIDESDGEDGETGGGLEALTTRLQSAGRPEETKKSEEPVRHRSSSEGWEQKQSSHRDRGSRDDGGKSRDRGEEKGRLKVEKTGRAMSGLPNQGNRSSRPRTPIGSPTRRASGEASFHGKERPKRLKKVRLKRLEAWPSYRRLKTLERPKRHILKNP